MNRKQRRAMKTQSSDPEEHFAIAMRIAQDREVVRRASLHVKEGAVAPPPTVRAVFEVSVMSVICALGLMKLYGAGDDDMRLMLEEAQRTFNEVEPMVTKLRINEQTQEPGES